ncbi:hypothetical protein L195_g033571 [Trifolium pratense]|uniref:Retrotransposon Copia-like N-terminal domain-containing protein n=1 Tax=Trifolium pratense TaxID=57577 RepID=A0A2K3LGE5_TRIPR|nr:hypothetical protein L195_g033571 [Trifolium pratense]
MHKVGRNSSTNSERPSNYDKVGGRGRGQYRAGGTRSNSRRARKGPVHAHAVHNLGSNIVGDSDNVTGLSKEQWQTLVELLNTSKSLATLEIHLAAAMAEKKNESKSQNKPSPYDLHSNDNSGSIITQVQMCGEENYDKLSKAIKTSLTARRKWGFIDGTIKKLEEGSSIMEDWLTVQAMLVSWILNTIEPTLRTTISYFETAKELWDDIKERFSIGNGPRIQQLKSDLAQCKQGKFVHGCLLWKVESSMG